MSFWFLILKENSALSEPTYKSGQPWLIQAEERNHCPSGQQDKGQHLYYSIQCDCFEKQYHTRLAKQSNVLAFGRTISLSINAHIT